MKIKNIDHIVMTVVDIEKTVAFYTTVLGMEAEIFNGNRYALKFGTQKINLHQKGNEFNPKAQRPTCGAIDFCLISETNLETVKQELISNNITIVEDIVERTGAVGKIESIYFQDPDFNLIKLSKYC